MATRRAAREALAALFVTNGSFTTVNDYVPVDMKGTNKVLNIYAAASRLDRMTNTLKNNFHTYNLDVFVLRDGADSEDELDTLHEAIIAVCVANPTNANWSHLQMSEQSQVISPVVAGTAYRMERHKVTVKITG